MFREMLVGTTRGACIDVPSATDTFNGDASVRYSSYGCIWGPVRDLYCRFLHLRPDMFFRPFGHHRPVPHFEERRPNPAQRLRRTKSPERCIE